MKLKPSFRLLALTALLLCSAVVGSGSGWYADKYSMFVHYGLYSIPGGVFRGEPVKEGYSEQILTFGIGFSDWYEAYTQEFVADRFDAEALVALAKAGGMRSIVFTSKHHDGFCLFNTSTTPYNSVDATPSGRDLVGELANACHKAGLGFGIYFSLIDWHYPQAVPFSSHNADPITPEHHKYNLAQVRELLTNYGRVDELWFDMGSLTVAQSKELYQLVHKLQPECMVSGRVGNDYADFSVMADNEYPTYPMVMPWQTAASMFNETWGYRSWQERGSVEQKVEEKFVSLLNVVALGGKYLLNIGPMGDGSVVPFEEEVVRGVGALIEPIAEAIYNTRPTPYTGLDEGVLTTMSQDGLTLYLFLPRGVASYTLPPTQSRVKCATLLPFGEAVEWRQLRNKRVELEIVPGKSEQPYFVVKIELKEPLSVLPSMPLLHKGVHAPTKGQALYAHSAVDYYTGFRSIVGYEWQVAKRRTPELLFMGTELGRKVEVNGKLHTLRSKGKEVVEVVPNAFRLEGPLYQGEQRGRLGVVKPEYLMAELVDTLWHATEATLLDPIERTIRSRGGVHLRQEIVAQEAMDLPLELKYSDGVLVFLNGTYIDGAVERNKEGMLSLLLPLQAGSNMLVIRLYNRWGYSCSLQVLIPKRYTLHSMKLPPLGEDGLLRITKLMEVPQATPAHLSGLRVRVK